MDVSGWWRPMLCKCRNQKGQPTNAAANFFLFVGWVIDNFVFFFFVFFSLSTDSKNQNGDILARRSCWFIAAAKWRHFQSLLPRSCLKFWSHDGDRNWAMIQKLLHRRCQCCWFQQSRVETFFFWGGAIPASKITFLLRLYFFLFPFFPPHPISEATTTNEMTPSHSSSQTSENQLRRVRASSTAPLNLWTGPQPAGLERSWWTATTGNSKQPH